MAMTACRECGGKVAESASVCPHCGISTPDQASNVFRWIFGVVGAGILVLSALAFAVNGLQSSRQPVAAPSRDAPCEPFRFSVVAKREWVDSLNVMHVVGAATNNCHRAAGIDVTWRGVHKKDGIVVFTDPIPDYSLSRIEPGQTVQFEDQRSFPSGGTVTTYLAVTKVLDE